MSKGRIWPGLRKTSFFEKNPKCAYNDNYFYKAISIIISLYPGRGPHSICYGFLLIPLPGETYEGQSQRTH